MAGDRAVQGPSAVPLQQAEAAVRGLSSGQVRVLPIPAVPLQPAEGSGVISGQVRVLPIPAVPYSRQRAAGSSPDR